MNPTEKEYLRELAKKQLELANTEENLEKKARWYAHNRGERVIPPIIMEWDPFEKELLPEFKCTSPVGRQIERELLFNLTNYELVGDDKVIPDYFRFYFSPEIQEFSMTIPRHHAGTEGFSMEHPIQDLEEDWEKIRKTSYSFDRETFDRNLAEANDVLADIMPVSPENDSLYWRLAPSSKVFDLMGMENMMISFYDYPELMLKLYQFIADDMKEYIAWQEKEGILTANNGNQIAGSGSYGFSDELYPKDKVVTKDMWGFLSSQETVTISPEMYHEFLFESYKQLAEMFGHVYYGCCEPVDPIWEKTVSKLPNLRKVSISAWCNEEYMGQMLKDTNIIYSRKPSPNFVGVGQKLDEEAFAAYMENTLKAADGCALEFIFRDIYTLGGDRNKAARAVQITRQLINKYY